jgi:hypothetical protein
MRESDLAISEQTEVRNPAQNLLYSALSDHSLKTTKVNGDLQMENLENRDFTKKRGKIGRNMLKMPNSVDFKKKKMHNIISKFESSGDKMSKDHLINIQELQIR